MAGGSAHYIEDKLYGRIAWRIVPMLFAVQMLGMVDRYNVGFAKIPMAADIGLSNASYGLGAGLFFIGYFIFEIPSNVILSRVGPRVWFTRILITWGIATVAMAFVRSEGWFYLLRFLVGAAEAGFAPGVQLYFSRWFPNSRRGRINGMFLMSLPFAGIVSGPASGLVLSRFSETGSLHPWQWLFVIEGAITICFAPLLLVFLPDTPARTKWLTPRERTLVESSAPAAADPAGSHAMTDFFRSPKTLPIMAVYFLLLLGNYGLSFWMPQIIHNSGVSSPMAVGWLSSLPPLCALIAMPIVSRLSDAGGRKWFIVAGCVLSAIGLLTTSLYSSDTRIALLGLSLTAVGVLASVPVFWAYCAKCYVGPAAVIGFAAINSVGNLAGFVAPYQIGLVADATGSPVNGIYAIAIGAVFAAALVAWRFEAGDFARHPATIVT